MKRLAFDPDPNQPLDLQLACRLGPLVGRPVSVSEVGALLDQGSVYRDKVRWRTGGNPGPGSGFEVFWPDLPVEEFTLDRVRVTWEDDHLLVVDKPAGVNTAPSPFSDRDCLTWGVQKLLGPGFPIHAVHRLDRDTRGLVLFAKHKQAELGLHALFRGRRVRKVYRALTPPFDLGGSLPTAVYRWRDHLDYRGRVQTAATTAWRSGTDLQGRFVWTVLPHTGRPHQIRRHFARYLVPLWGDRAYGGGGDGHRDPLGLACVAYRFSHPITGELVSVSLGPEGLVL